MFNSVYHTGIQVSNQMEGEKGKIFHWSHFVHLYINITMFLFILQLNLSTEWLCFVDRITQYTQHKQDYSLMKYVPFLPVAFHMMYASFVPPRISFPHVQFEVSEDLGLIAGCMQ